MTPEQHEILVRIDERVGVLTTNQEDQEHRLRRLEKWRNVLAGALAILGSAFGIKTHNLL